MHEFRAPLPTLRALLLLPAAVLVTAGCGDGYNDSPADASRVATAKARVLPVPTVVASRTIRLPGDKVFPEGITFDPDGKRIYVSSTTDGTIFTGARKARRLAALPRAHNGPQVSVGLATGRNGTLWVAGGQAGIGWLLDRRSGKVLGRHLAPGSGASFVNDVDVARDGTAYFTDSSRPTIYAASPRMKPGEPLRAFADLSGGPIPSNQQFNLNGIVVTGDQRNLLVVHSGNGRLYRIPIAGGPAVEVDLGGMGQLPGGDGLALVGRTLYVVQGERGVIAIVDLDKSWARGSIRGTITDPSLARPTTLAVRGKELFVVNSQFDKQGGTPNLPFTVSVLRLRSTRH